MSRTALFAGSAFRRTGASVTVEQCRGCYRHYSKNRAHWAEELAEIESKRIEKETGEAGKA